MTVICQYCGNEAKRVNGMELCHRHYLKEKLFWRCDACGALVSCHEEGTWILVAGRTVPARQGEPVGPLADANLRQLKKLVRHKFDQLWQIESLVDEDGVLTWGPKAWQARISLSFKFRMHMQRIDASTLIKGFDERQARYALLLLNQLDYNDLMTAIK